jgi:hypothetical protein
MDRITRVGVITVLSFGLFAGCGKNGSSGGATATGSGPAIVETDPASNPIAKAAYDFLDAVLKGDTQRASSRLTPQAIQRIVSSGKQFSPPGLETATFKIGEVRAPTADQAIVQCVLTDSSQGSPHSEEMCCLLRKVENDWRVSGIAYGTTPDKPWTLTDFESGKSMAIPRQTMTGMASTQEGGGQEANVSSQASTVSPPGTPSASPGAPSAGVPNGNTNVSAPTGLGMPAVGPPSTSPNALQPQVPYTAQEPQNLDRR